MSRSIGPAGKVPDTKRANPTYFAGDLRRALLDTAADGIAAGGAASVSLRGLARQVGVSHAAPAHHFGDKAGLFTALAIEGFDMLTASMHTQVAKAKDEPAHVRLVKTGVGYVGFAARHRAHFEIMFRPDLLRHEDPEYVRASAESAAVLSDHVLAAQAQGWAPHVDSVAIVTIAWALVHGLATLATQGALGEISEPKALERLTERLATLVAEGVGSVVQPSA